MKVLVVGDRIFDNYMFCKATRLCPEAPAPVLIVKEERTSEGGAALVAENLKSLIGEKNVFGLFGSVSNKYRIFADRHLMCRVDHDRYSLMDTNAYWNQILAFSKQVDVIVVGDYGKGAIGKNIATGLVALNKLLFVDAKADPEPYKGCFAIFPNEDEHNGLRPGDYRHIIRKLGPRGCSVDNMLVSTEEQQIYDVTGAGDVFLAAFVARFVEVWSHVTVSGLLPDSKQLLECAKYANKAAGISVKHLGTYVVKPEELL